MTIILGDLHFGKKGFQLKQYQNQIDFFHKQLFPHIRRNNINHVICLGDLFDHRTRQDINILLKIRNEFLNFFEENEIKLTVLVGNHDIYFNNTRDVFTLQLFEHYKYLNIINKPTLMKIGNIEWELFPWLVEGETFEPRTNHIMGHFEINGFNMVGGFKCTYGMEVSSMKNMEKVLSGHFHIKQDNGVIHYLGTPYALDWNDYNQERGFYIMDDNGSMEFIENDVSFKFIDAKRIVDNGDVIYTIGKEITTLNKIEEFANKGHQVRISSTEELPVNSNSSVIVDIVENEDIKDYNNDIEAFIKDSLSENSYKEYTKLFNTIVNEN